MARRPKPWYRKARRSWFVTIAGVQHNLGPEKSEAYEQFHQLMRQPRQQKVSPQSLAAIADAFLDWTKRNRAVATYGWYRDHLQSFLKEHRDLTVAQLRPHHVETWASDDRHSVNTKRNHMRAVKRCLRWALSQGHIDFNPISSLEIPGAISREVYISPEQLAELLKLIPHAGFADLLTITYETGCRPQELLRVTSQHVDLGHSRWILPISESKGKSMPRVVYLNGVAQEITKQAMVKWPNGPMFRNSSGTAWTSDAVNCAFDRLRLRIGRIEIQRRGEVFSEATITKAMRGLASHRTVKGSQVKKSAKELRSEARRKLEQRLARKLAPNLSLYAMRHSFATNALQRGIDALTVAILMGHKDPSTLARTYQHLSHNPEHLLAQAEKAAG